jgi:hypothetical protein
MGRKFTETVESKGKIAYHPVRYRTEIGVCFPGAAAKFLVGLQRDSWSAA